MTAQILENFEKICRCCLCKNGEMQPLFGCHLDNMLRFVAGIEVSNQHFLQFFIQLNLKILLWTALMYIDTSWRRITRVDVCSMCVASESCIHIQATM